MNAQGMDVISLGIGSPDMPPSEQTIKALCESAPLANVHGYQPYIGIPELREGFADFYQKWYGVTLDAATEILPLIGSKEGILYVTLAFVNPGDKVLVPNPGYPTYSALSKLLGAEVVYYDLKEDNHWQPDFEALEQMDLSGVKLMWANYPNMPTGANASVELYQKLVNFARKHNIVVVNDNPYSLILNQKPLSMMSIDGAKECCIELNSMSKSHNMPGWRVGMMAANATFIQWVLSKIECRFGYVQTLAIGCSSCFAQRRCLARGHEHGIVWPTSCCGRANYGGFGLYLPKRSSRLVCVG